MMSDNENGQGLFTIDQNPSLWNFHFKRVHKTDMLAIQLFHPFFFVEVFVNLVCGNVFSGGQPSSIDPRLGFRVRVWREVLVGIFYIQRLLSEVRWEGGFIGGKCAEDGLGVRRRYVGL